MYLGGWKSLFSVRMSRSYSVYLVHLGYMASFLRMRIHEPDSITLLKTSQVWHAFPMPILSALERSTRCVLVFYVKYTNLGEAFDDSPLELAS